MGMPIIVKVVDRGIRKEVFEKIGYFDERFFMYFEDADFCLRATQAGFSVRVNPDVIVRHNIKEHRYILNRHKNKYQFKSNILFSQKWVPWYFLTISYFYLFLIFILYELNLVKFRLKIR